MVTTALLVERVVIEKGQLRIVCLRPHGGVLGTANMKLTRRHEQLHRGSVRQGLLPEPLPDGGAGHAGVQQGAGSRRQRTVGYET